jgi:RHS repeat-associated protein
LYMSTGWVAYDNVDLKKVGTSTNLVTNPGFEDAAGWSEWRSSSYPGTSFLRATSGTAAPPPQSGLYAYAISNHSQGNLQSDSVSVTPNSDYDLYAFIRGELDPDDSHGAWRLRVNYYDSAGTYLTYQDAASGNPGGLTAAWQYLGGRITTPANAASLKVRLYSYQTSGWIAIDDVSLTQKVSDTQTTDLTYDAENRLVEVKLGSTTIAAFTYDGDGNRVKGVVGSITTVYIGNYFEWTGSTTTMKKYYYAGGQRVAVRTGSSTLNWLLGDHLGSAMVQTDANGGNPQVNLYKAWGEPRPTGSLPSPFGFTGQRSEPVLGLYFYNARWYDSYLNRFLQADSIIPGAGNPLAWDRYAYTLNAPTRYTDPSGHMVADDKSGGECNWVCMERSRQDFLVSLVLKGSNSTGSWSADDYK